MVKNFRTGIFIRVTSRLIHCTIISLIGTISTVVFSVAKKFGRDASSATTAEDVVMQVQFVIVTVGDVRERAALGFVRAV